MPGLIRDASSANVSAVDAPAVDAPAVDAPAVDAPAVDAPAVDAPAVDAPAVDVPAVDAPAVDAPAVDLFAVDAPAVDAPAVDAPAVDAPAVDAPAVDAPAVDAPAVDAPAVDAPAVNAPFVDAPAVDVHAAVNAFATAHHDVQSEELQQRASFPYNYNTNHGVRTSANQFFSYSLNGNPQNPLFTYCTQNQQQNNTSDNNVCNMYQQENVTVEHLPMSWPHFCNCCGPHCRCYRMTISNLNCDQINALYNLIYSNAFQSNFASCSVNFVHIDQ